MLALRHSRIVALQLGYHHGDYEGLLPSVMPVGSQCFGVNSSVRISVSST